MTDPIDRDRVGHGTQADPNGRLVDNIVHFARALRHAGLKIGPSATLDAVHAVRLSGFATRDDFYWILHASLVSRHEDGLVFDEVFRLFWRSRELVEKMIAMFSPVAPPRETDPGKARSGTRRASDAMLEGAKENRPPEGKPTLEIDARATMSEKEVLRHMDFAQMSAAELARARAAIDGFELVDDRIVTRRFTADPGGRLIDPRATLRSSMRRGGELVLPRFKRNRSKPVPIVVLADISGSMAEYSRILLHFVHALMERRTDVQAFLFGTRLTNVTRQLRRKDPDQALAECADAAGDWSGGTRIAEALHRFNKDWSRRVLGRAATVLLITDGLERGSPHDLEAEIERLHLSSRRLVWLNPLLRFDEFSARARGVRTMLRHVDEFRPVHSLAAMEDLCAALRDPRAGSADPEFWLRATRSWPPIADRSRPSRFHRQRSDLC